PLQRSIATMPVSDGTKSFLLATLTGDREWLTPSTRTLFSNTGIAHILALSGLHVGVITALLLIILLPLSGMRGGRHLRLIITVAVLWIFAILTGLTPSVVRAVIMATMFAVCTMLQRVWSPLNALSAAAIIILLVTPTAVYSLGFILTFSAVLSIIIFADALNPVDPRHRTARNAVGYLCVTIAAILGTGIVCAYCFHIVPVYFLLTNVVVSILLPPLLGFGITGVMLNAIGIKAAWLCRLLDWLYGMIDRTAEAVSSLPGSMISDIWMPGWTLPIYYILLVIFALYLCRRRVALLYAMAMILAGAIIIGMITAPVCADSEVYITRSHTETTMLVKDGKQLYSYTTARVGAVNDIRMRDESRYKGYMIRRDIHAITPLTDGFRDGSTGRKDNMILAGG
ncbi:MAG: ComEC/Rec2 family competence protein, partial [Duncaniella sp.]|nr:ComEC/Rec2 family competence protein [Duncaniella sp.]